MKQTASPEKQCEILAKGAVDFVSKTELLNKLRENRPLRIKAGFDPSRPDIHLGHLLLIGKLREFQDLGHRVLFVAGDWTACIGDPSGQNKTRPMISREEARQNAQTYKDQVFRQTFPLPEGADQKTRTLHHRLRRLDPDKTEFVFNSRWLDKLSLEAFTSNIVSRITLNRLLERKDFSERYEVWKKQAGKSSDEDRGFAGGAGESSNKVPGLEGRQEKWESINLHELIYPVLQAYDSVELKADMEIGGTDQLFNLLMGRELQKKLGQEPQCVLTLPLLKGLDEGAKMSQSSGNTLSFQDSAEDIFGKVMSVTDDLMMEYWEILGGAGADYRRDVKNKNLHPMKEKELLAESLTRVFWSDAPAKREKDGFRKKYSLKQRDDIPEEPLLESPGMPLCDLLEELSISSSFSEARRLIGAGAVRWNNEKITDPHEIIDLLPGKPVVLKVGRKFVKICIDSEPIKERDDTVPLESEKVLAHPLQNHSAVSNQIKRDTVPPSREFYLPVLKFVAKGQNSSVADIERDIINHFNLSEKAKGELTRMGNQRKVFSRMRWPITHFSKAKLINGNTQKGFSITQKGEDILKQIEKEGIKIINLNYLRKNCPAFREWEDSAYSPPDSESLFLPEKPYIQDFDKKYKIEMDFHPHLMLLNSIKGAEKKGPIQLQDIEIQIPTRVFDPDGIPVLVQNSPPESEQEEQKRWGATDLLRAQLIAGSVREGFTVTDKGRKLLERVSKEKVFIDTDFLRRNYPVFRDRENHSIPPSREFYLPVLESIAGKTDSKNKQNKTNPKKIKDIEWDLIEHFSLSEQAVQERTFAGNQRKVFDRMRWAVTHLSKAQLISGDGRTGFSITPKGTDILENISKEGTKIIDRSYLRKNCPAFRKWEDRN